MTKILTLTMEVSDQEFAAFMTRWSDRGVVAGAGASAAPAGAADDESAGDAPADPTTLDKAGVPWLEAVHASTKGQTKDGLWRGKKGVTPEQRAVAEKAWKDSNASFTVPGSITGGQPVTLPVSMPSLPGPAAVGGMPMMPGLPVAPPAPVSYDELVAKFNEKAAAGKITPDGMMALYAKHNVNDPTVLGTNETIRRALFDELNALV